MRFGVCHFCCYPVTYSLVPLPFSSDFASICQLCVRLLCNKACFEEMAPGCDV